ncbi:CDP-diacylglycerol--glycerol-3-phosphate 3-phosphatidyltransferase [Thalassospira lucentensis]|uniref:CDP-diacylglycerol--glycerol-3-phosphate 3-phosphatidyltransferase n=1 Tax=Thalassospira lucentensis TaxID=168935 RepID=UPI00142DEB04|nr:CDP-diacylglycerol--glycerol-3-phosphate 3-phosphatidyltransferase [Thalassospira lucentensis]NIZ00335.1 CDP-diacylglycerol--glycerol-3-phosphate 3-phosphatidyltransferase [Thalassospira lucentensis]
MKNQIPNILTLSRIFVIPALVASFYIDGPVGNWLGFALFAFAGVTDFFDGYLARSMNVVSPLGRFLDPIADKLLVAAALMMMVSFERIAGLSVLPAVIIMCREIMVSGLREHLAELKVPLPVTVLAKWKTTAQILAIGFLLVGDASPDLIPSVLIGDILLWIAGIVTVQTGYIYLRTGLKHLD